MALRPRRGDWRSRRSTAPPASLGKNFFPMDYLPAGAASLHRALAPMDLTRPICFSFECNLSEVEDFPEKRPDFVKAIPCRKLQGGFTDRDCGPRDRVVGRCLFLVEWLDRLYCLGAYVCRWERLNYLLCPWACLCCLVRLDGIVHGSSLHLAGLHRRMAKQL
jgi:hypothetical protein